MTVKSAFSKTLPSESGTQNYTYAAVIPAAFVTQSGGFVRIKLVSGSLPLQMQNVYFGTRASGGDFSGDQFHMTVGGLTEWAIPANGTVYSDPVAFSVAASTAYILRFDAPNVAGQRYKYSNAVTGGALYFKTGNRGALNADNALGSGFSTLASWLSTIAGIEVTDALEDFDAPGSPDPDAGVSFLSDLEQRAVSNTLFAAGAGFVGEAGKRIFCTLTVPAPANVLAFVDMIDLVLTDDSEVTIHTYTPPVGTSQALIQTGCNVNFNPSGAPGPKSRINKWSSDTATPASIAARHTGFKLFANKGKNLFVPRGFLGVVYPEIGAGLTLCINTPGVGAHFEWQWHEKVIA